MAESKTDKEIMDEIISILHGSENIFPSNEIQKLLINNDIKKDFQSCNSLFKLVTGIIKNTIQELKINENDSEEVKESKQSTLNEILIMMGRVGELATKYLLKIKQQELDHGQNFVQFSETEQIYKKGKLKNLVNKGVISPYDFDELSTYYDENKDGIFHNFFYMMSVLKKVSPKTVENFEECIKYHYTSRELMDKYKDNIIGFKQFVLFPELLWMIDGEIENETIGQLKDDTLRLANECGDIFVRLRYYSNNYGKSLNTLDTLFLFNYLEVLVEFINGIHQNHDNLLTSSNWIHGLETALQYPNLTGRNEKEINDFFNDFVDNDSLYLSQKLLCGQSNQDIKKLELLCKEYGLDSFMVIDHGIHADELIIFHEHGCDDYQEMQNYIFDEKLRRRSLKEIEELLNSRKY